MDQSNLKRQSSNGRPAQTTRSAARDIDLRTSEDDDEEYPKSPDSEQNGFMGFISPTPSSFKLTDLPDYVPLEEIIVPEVNATPSINSNQPIKTSVSASPSLPIASESPNVDANLTTHGSNNHPITIDSRRTSSTTPVSLSKPELPIENHRNSVNGLPIPEPVNQHIKLDPVSDINIQISSLSAFDLFTQSFRRDSLDRANAARLGNNNKTNETNSSRPNKSRTPSIEIPTTSKAANINKKHDSNTNKVNKQRTISLDRPCCSKTLQNLKTPEPHTAKVNTRRTSLMDPPTGSRVIQNIKTNELNASSLSNRRKSSSDHPPISKTIHSVSSSETIDTNLKSRRKSSLDRPSSSKSLQNNHTSDKNLPNQVSQRISSLERQCNSKSLKNIKTNGTNVSKISSKRTNSLDRPSCSKSAQNNHMNDVNESKLRTRRTSSLDRPSCSKSIQNNNTKETNGSKLTNTRTSSLDRPSCSKSVPNVKGNETNGSTPSSQRTSSLDRPSGSKAVKNIKKNETNAEKLNKHRTSSMDHSLPKTTKRRTSLVDIATISKATHSLKINESKTCKPNKRRISAMETSATETTTETATANEVEINEIVLPKSNKRRTYSTETSNSFKTGNNTNETNIPKTHKRRTSAMETRASNNVKLNEMKTARPIKRRTSSMEPPTGLKTTNQIKTKASPSKAENKIEIIDHIKLPNFNPSSLRSGSSNSLTSSTSTPAQNPSPYKPVNQVPHITADSYLDDIEPCSSSQPFIIEVQQLDLSNLPSTSISNVETTSPVPDDKSASIDMISNQISDLNIINLNGDENPLDNGELILPDDLINIPDNDPLVIEENTTFSLVDLDDDDVSMTSAINNLNGNANYAVVAEDHNYLAPSTPIRNILLPNQNLSCNLTNENEFVEETVEEVNILPSTIVKPLNTTDDEKFKHKEPEEIIVESTPIKTSAETRLEEDIVSNINYNLSLLVDSVDYTLSDDEPLCPKVNKKSKISTENEELPTTSSASKNDRLESDSSPNNVPIRKKKPRRLLPESKIQRCNSTYTNKDWEFEKTLDLLYKEHIEHENLLKGLNNSTEQNNGNNIHFDSIFNLQENCLQLSREDGFIKMTNTDLNNIHNHNSTIITKGKSLVNLDDTVNKDKSLFSCSTDQIDSFAMSQAIDISAIASSTLDTSTLGSSALETSALEISTDLEEPLNRNVNSPTSSVKGKIYKKQEFCSYLGLTGMSTAALMAAAREKIALKRRSLRVRIQQRIKEQQEELRRERDLFLKYQKSLNDSKLASTSARANELEQANTRESRKAFVRQNRRSLDYPSCVSFQPSTDYNDNISDRRNRPVSTRLAKRSYSLYCEPKHLREDFTRDLKIPKLTYKPNKDPAVKILCHISNAVNKSSDEINVLDKPDNKSSITISPLSTSQNFKDINLTKQSKDDSFIKNSSQFTVRKSNSFIAKDRNTTNSDTARYADIQEYIHKEFEKLLFESRRNKPAICILQTIENATQQTENESTNDVSKEEVTPELIPPVIIDLSIRKVSAVNEEHNEEKPIEKEEPKTAAVVRVAPNEKKNEGIVENKPTNATTEKKKYKAKKHKRLVGISLITRSSQRILRKRVPKKPSIPVKKPKRRSKPKRRESTALKPDVNNLSTNVSINTFTPFLVPFAITTGTSSASYAKKKNKRKSADSAPMHITSDSYEDVSDSEIIDSDKAVNQTTDTVEVIDPRKEKDTEEIKEIEEHLDPSEIAYNAYINSKATESVQVGIMDFENFFQAVAPPPFERKRSLSQCSEDSLGPEDPLDQLGGIALIDDSILPPVNSTMETPPLDHNEATTTKKSDSTMNSNFDDELPSTSAQALINSSILKSIKVKDAAAQTINDNVEVHIQTPALEKTDSTTQCEDTEGARLLSAPKKFFENPLFPRHGKVLYMFYEANCLVVVQEKLLTFWRFSHLANLIAPFGQHVPSEERDKSWENSNILWYLIGRIHRRNYDVEITNGCLSRICVMNNLPMYFELRCHEYQKLFRECNLSALYVNIYFYNVEIKKFKMHCVDLDAVQSVPDSLIYLTLPASAAIIICWSGTDSQSKRKSGLVKYIISEKYDILENILRFKYIHHEIKSIDLLNDDQLLGYGDTRITIWGTTSGDVLLNYDLHIPIGKPLGTTIFPDFHIHNVVLLYQYNPVPEDDGFCELFVIAFDTTTMLPDYKVLCRHKIPKEFLLNMKRKIHTGSHIVITTAKDEDIWLSATDCTSIVYMYPRPSKRFYMKNFNYLVELTENHLGLISMTEFLVNVATDGRLYKSAVKYE